MTAAPSSMIVRQRLNLLRLQSDLTDQELAFLYGVTARTLYNWSEGKRAPTGLRGRKAEQVSVGLCTALAKGLLPLANLDKEQRRDRLTRMRKQLDVAVQNKL